MMIIWDHGTKIKKAIEKYGIKNFKKEILFDFNTEKEMLEKEKEIVNEEFLKRNDVYNMVLGGNVGWNKLPSEWGKLGAKCLYDKRITDQEFNRNYLKKLKNALNNPIIKEKIKISKEKHFKENGRIYSFSGKHYSIESRIKISETHKNKNYQKGINNSQYGKQWISNLSKKQSISVQIESLLFYINSGWLIGRILDFDKFLEKYNDALTKKEKWHFIDYEKDIKENKIPRILKNKKKPKEENKNVQKCFLSKFDTNEEKINLLKEYFEEYKINGYKGVVKKFNYSYTSQALLGAFKRYLPEEYEKQKRH